MGAVRSKPQTSPKGNSWTFDPKVFQSTDTFVDYLKKAAETRDPMSLGALFQLHEVSKNMRPNGIRDLGITGEDLDRIDTHYYEAIRKIGISGIPELVRLIREDPIMNPSAMKCHWFCATMTIAEANPGREELLDLLQEVVKFVKPIAVQMASDAEYVASIEVDQSALQEIKRMYLDVLGESLSDSEAKLCFVRMVKDIDAWSTEAVLEVTSAVDALTNIARALPKDKKPLNVLVPLFENLQTHIPSLRDSCIAAIQELTGSNPTLTDGKGES